MQVGTQFSGTVAAGAAQRWLTHSWPAAWHVVWTVVPTTPDRAPRRWSATWRSSRPQRALTY